MDCARGISSADLGSAKSFAKSRQQSFLSLQHAGADDYTGALNLFQCQEILRLARPNNGPRRHPTTKLSEEEEAAAIHADSSLYKIVINLLQSPGEYAWRVTPDVGMIRHLTVQLLLPADRRTNPPTRRDAG